MKKILSLLVAATLSGCSAEDMKTVHDAAFPLKALNNDIDSGKIKVIHIINERGGGMTIMYSPGLNKELDAYQSGDDLVLTIKSGKGITIKRYN